MDHLGVAGKIARAFIDSKLTPLIVAAALLLGLYAVITTPREEEPQIVVPMVDIYLPLPGSSPKEVEERVVKPVEMKMWEIKGVEYVYSMSRPGMGRRTTSKGRPCGSARATSRRQASCRGSKFSSARSSS